MSKDEALSTVRALKLALKALENNRQTHHYCEDTWYSCPKHEDGCANDAEGDECNCGADKANAEIDATITAIKEALMSHSDGAQPEPWEKFCDSNCVWTDHHPDCKLAQQEPWPDEPVGHIAGGVHPPQRTWVNATTWRWLTDEDIKPFCDANHIIFGAYTIDFVRAIEAKLKANNSL